MLQLVQVGVPLSCICRMKQAQEKITKQLQQRIQQWFQHRFMKISNFPLFASIVFVGAFDLVRFALGPELMPVGGTRET